MEAPSGEPAGEARLRVGSVPYLVARPLDGGLGDEPGIELTHDVPARLVEKLRAGAIDVALVSSIELFRRPGYGYLDSLAVAGEERVSSVQVFLRRPVDSVATVALDPASRAAQALTQVVWPTEARPRFLEVAAGEDPRGTDADAWLRIGDAALREALEEGAPPTLNPSATWREQTGLPFAFAVWIVRPGVDVAPWAGAFARARARGRRAAAELAREAAERWELPLAATEDYLLRECLYEPGERLRPALFTFRDRAAALGLCEAGLAPHAAPLAELDPAL